MIKKVVIVVISCLLFVFIIFPKYSFCDEQTPEQFVNFFYQWYITADQGKRLAIENDGIYRYVDKETIKNVKCPKYKDNRDKRDYFLKMSDTPLDMSSVSISVSKATPLDDIFFVLLATITVSYTDCFIDSETNTTQSVKGSHSHYVVVVLKKLQGDMKILKCMDIYPEV